jgi:hypothetical protein
VSRGRGRKKKRQAMNEQEVLNRRLMEAAGSGDLSGLIQALDGGANAKWDGSEALARAAWGGHVECVELLIEVSDAKAGDSWALRQAAESGHVECVRLLMEVVDAKWDGSAALGAAAAEGHSECVRLLLPASDPLAVGIDGLDAAGLARQGGHVEVAAMIEAFIESQALSGCVQTAKMNSRVKAAL